MAAGSAIRSNPTPSSGARQQGASRARGRQGSGRQPGCRSARCCGPCASDWLSARRLAARSVPRRATRPPCPGPARGRRPPASARGRAQAGSSAGSAGWCEAEHEQHKRVRDRQRGERKAGPACGAGRAGRETRPTPKSSPPSHCRPPAGNCAEDERQLVGAEAVADDQGAREIGENAEAERGERDPSSRFRTGRRRQAG